MRTMVSTSGFLRLRYPSFRALDVDHTNYIVHGGVRIAVSGHARMYEDEHVNVQLILPDQNQITTTARVMRVHDDGHILLGFDPEHQPPLAELHRWVTSDAFLEQLNREPTEPTRVTVEWIQTQDSSPATPSFINEPKPGDSFWRVELRYPTVLSCQSMVKELESSGHVNIPVSQPSPEPNETIKLKFVMPGHNIFELWAKTKLLDPPIMTLEVPKDIEAFRRLCLYPTTKVAQSRQQRELEQSREMEAPTYHFFRETIPEEMEKMPLRRRIQRMTTEEKINLALSGKREERMALAQDSNRQIHHYLLRNAKITLEEVAFMARLTSLNPDVLEKIAENPGYTQNPQVAKALVFNPRTRINTAMRLLGRLPRNELMILSRRTGMNRRLLEAVKNRLGGV